MLLASLSYILFGEAKGAFNNYVDRILPFFDPPSLRGQFLYPKHGQKQTFFDPLFPHLVHVVIEWTLVKNAKHVEFLARQLLEFLRL